jgi:hypothetical protein
MTNLQVRVVKDADGREYHAIFHGELRWRNWALG